ncbi:MAG: ribbon-helix-helix domain-containing protein [Candidatus Bathyarchaeia archaeon]
MTQKRNRRWTTIAIPQEIAQLIDKVVESQQYGFRSRTDFILEAVKLRLKELGYYP